MGDPNFRMLKRSSKKPRSGDVFMMSPNENTYVFGVVVNGEALVGSVTVPLIYVLDLVLDAEPEEVPSGLEDAGLLLPPLFTNALGWRHGYFKTIGSIDPDRIRFSHGFHNPQGRIVDDHGQTASEPVRPLGTT